MTTLPNSSDPLPAPGPPLRQEGAENWQSCSWYCPPGDPFRPPAPPQRHASRQEPVSRLPEEGEGAAAAARGEQAEGPEGVLEEERDASEGPPRSQVPALCLSNSPVRWRRAQQQQLQSRPGLEESLESGQTRAVDNQYSFI
ncbi:hypothetical protein chiPu_0030871 [Chiloscyllium punctatum]|uniref:Uncharacterized protein n=1 Tax=Chiloscyllium punctatum TaxID=137246 RepID=A0A401TVJ9_CHIPU|nr:hypothetical protein [Chiloscyllium punctatum]